MYAVIETGGKQYRVELGTEVAVERLDAMPGTTIDIDRVLLVADGDNAHVGTPTVADALVTADVLRQDRGEKLIVFKYRPKARHRAKNGHRQEQTILRVADIRFNGRSAADEAGTQKSDKKAEREQAKAEAERKAAADQALAAKLAGDSKSAADAAASDQPTAKSPARKSATEKAPAKNAEPKSAEAKTAAPKGSTAAKRSTAAKKTSTTAAAKAPAAKAAPKTQAATAKAKPKPKTTQPRAPRSSKKKDE